MKQTLKDYEELMKPRIITCGQCNGKLHIIPYRDGKGIKTMNICGKCTFTKESK